MSHHGPIRPVPPVRRPGWPAGLAFLAGLAVFVYGLAHASVLNSEHQIGYILMGVTGLVAAALAFFWGFIFSKTARRVFCFLSLVAFAGVALVIQFYIR